MLFSYWKKKHGVKDGTGDNKIVNEIYTRVLDTYIIV
jgi:hypothetical protein